MALLHVESVTKRFVKGDQTITPLESASLVVERGDFVSLMGASGSGKSTLLNLIAGIDRPTSGSIVVDGVDISQLSRTRLARWRAQNVGYIFQTHNLIPVLTAYENIEMPLLLLPLSRSERQRRVTVALEAVGLTDRAEHYPRQLSGGQEQRVGIARAIVASPTLVVADEPTGDLDAETSEQILVLLQRLNRELGMTLLMVTHDPDAAAIASRLFRLDHGRLLESSSASSIAIAS
ncbi:MAG: ABC transporter ATP-binding protein [Pirellulaceae bacterium]